MRNRYVFAAAVVALAALVAPARAVDGPWPDVFVGDGWTGVVWSFTDTTGMQLNANYPYNNVSGMAVTADWQLLVADASAGISRLDIETGFPTWIEPQAYGAVDVYPDSQTEDIFYAVNGDVASWICVLLGGVPPGIPCMDFGRGILDIQVYPMIGERAGHLLVLFGWGSENPPYLAEFERTGPTSFAELAPVVPEGTESATGFAVRPDGGIVYLDRDLGMFNVGPQGELTHFGPTSGIYGEDIDIGHDGTIYVADVEVDVVHRFTPEGGWILPSLGEGELSEPRAVAALGFVPTPPGSNVQVTPLEDVDILFEEVTGGGYTSASATTTPSRVSPGGNTLPDYAGAPGGRLDFTYVDLATTAVFENLIQIDVLLTGSRLFHAHGTGGVFQDATVTGSIEDARGVISRFSEVVLVEDSRPLSEVVDDKFDRLFAILTGPPYSLGVRKDLNLAKFLLMRRARSARILYLAGEPDAAIQELALLNEDCRSFAGTVIPNSSAHPEGNVAGEILARSKTLMFSLGLVEGGRGARGAASGGEATLSLACGSPATGECRFELAGPAGSRVTARLYAVTGRLVRTLYDGTLRGGTQTIVWDGTEDDGGRAASGVYLARAESDGTAVSGKVVFIR